MRTQFSFYKSFDDVYQDLSDKQKIEFINTLLDVQFLRVKIEDVAFKDVILKHIWNAQKHSLEKSISGYIESQKNPKIKIPFLGCYDSSFLPLQIPSEGDHKEDKEKEEDKEKYTIYSDVISYLNNKTNKSYMHSSNKTKELINARFNDGFLLDDFKKVIDIKSSEWLGTDFEKFLRPETLFSNKFEGYLNQSDGAKKTNNDLDGWE
jgi:uncharacterized phage protein (TIGR02220 family)